MNNVDDQFDDEDDDEDYDDFDGIDTLNSNYDSPLENFDEIINFEQILDEMS